MGCITHSTYTHEIRFLLYLLILDRSGTKGATTTLRSPQHSPLLYTATTTQRCSPPIHTPIEQKTMQRPHNTNGYKNNNPRQTTIDNYYIQENTYTDITTNITK